MDAVADLVAKSLVQSDETAQATTRYDMLETLRHYARERLDQESDADRWRRRHAEHYARFADEAGRAVRGPDELEWRARLRAELDNLRSAVAWSLDSNVADDNELALEIITALAAQQSFDPTLGIGAWATRAIDRAETSSPGRRYAVLAAAAYYAAVSGDFDRGRELVAAATRDGVPDDARWPVFGSTTLHFIEVNSGDHVRAVEICEEALVRYSDRMDLIEGMTLHATAAGTATWAGDQEAARAHAERGLEYGRASGSPSGIASSLFAYGMVMRSEDPVAAREALEECLALVEAGASPVMRGYAFSAVADLRAGAGEYRGALDALCEAFEYAIDSGNEALAEQIRGEAVPVLLEIAGAESAAVTLPRTWLTWAEDDEVSDPRSAAAAWIAQLQAVRDALGADEFERAKKRAASLSPRESAEAVLSELQRVAAMLDEGRDE